MPVENIKKINANMSIYVIITKGYQQLELARGRKKHENILKVLQLGMHLTARADLWPTIGTSVDCK